MELITVCMLTTCYPHRCIHPHHSHLHPPALHVSIITELVHDVAQQGWLLLWIGS